MQKMGKTLNGQRQPGGQDQTQPHQSIKGEKGRWQAQAA